jgi:hypothetical protein
MPTRCLAACTAALAIALTGTAVAQEEKKAPKPMDGNAVIAFGRVGPIKLGMTIAEARKAARRGIIAGPEVTKDCRHDTVLPRRFGLGTLRYKKKIRVLYVTRGVMPTRRGVRVGDSLNRLLSKYEGMLTERPSDVSPTTRIFELRDGTREMQFAVSSETNRIFQISTGLQPEVDFPEGCA